MRLMPLFLVLLLSCEAFGEQRTVTLYLDGAKVEVEEKGREGYLEFPLPAIVPGSLRVSAPGGAVNRVEVVSRALERPSAKERARLQARRGEVEDRLKALEVREEVFTAAARSQSGKSLRKTKNNPEPLAALRQGTEFCLGQLEGVYRARRKCEAELKEIDRELAEGRRGGAVAQVWLTGRKGRISYLTLSRKWTPAYSFRASGTGKAELLLHAKLPPAEQGVRYLVAPGTLAGVSTGRELAGDFPVLARYELPLAKEEYLELPYPYLSIAFSGGEGWWPPGEAAAFWKGAYVGAGRFAGGGAGELAFGK
ncbi:DUF4140 domain-containing protein [Geomonas sp. RF6]|uniref:DUF4140 domain-containing protein n=1 Tax=Geomonas sp. RF6 TaxID=2897342 RepID=UPI001E416E43|nr:DUF4140 domain-containing protein [Geomonas sp. RF6]UFS69073.1 DUF4140 domain-containing protein [Geomonas sp. RF6]